MKKYYLLVLLLFSIWDVSAQGVTTLGVPTGTVNAKGGFLVDSMLVMPLRGDTSFPPSYNAILRKTGGLVIKSSNLLPYIYNGSKWQNIIVGDSATLFGIYLAKANNLSDLTNAATARTNLGVPSLTGTGASGTWNIDITGNAATVTTNANLTGDVTSVGNATTLATVATGATVGGSTSIPTFTFNNKGLVTSASGNAVIAPAGTLTGTTLAANVVSSSLTSVGTLANLTVTNPIVGSITGSSGSTTGNAATATALQTPRTIGTITGDAASTGSSFDGSANNTNALTFATVNSNVGSFGSATQTPVFTVNGKGLITAASNISIQIGESQVTNLVSDLAGKQSTITFGTGVQAALANNIGSAGAPVLFNGALGTPSSGTGTNLTGIPQSGVTNLVSDLALKAPLASPTFTGTVTIPTPFNLGATSVTSTGTQLNYLNAATGTTGTTSTNLVFSEAPALTSTVTATNITDITLGAESALRVGGASNSTNITMGEYSSVLGIQGRNNGTSANLFLQPLGGGVSVGDGSFTGNRAFAVNNTGAGTGDYASIEVRNGSAGTDALRLYTLGTGFTTSGSNFKDGASVTSGTGLSGGLSIGTLASADLRFYTNNTLRTTWAGATGNITTTGQFLSSGGGIGYTTGAGGTVTQLTSRTTTVVNNKLCGTITMFSSAQASDAVVTFTLTNSFIASTDYVLVQHISATNGGAWDFSVVAGAGSATISIRNTSGASITEATPLRFFILKSVNN